MFFVGFERYVARLLEFFESRIENLFFASRVNVEFIFELSEEFFPAL